MDPEPMSAITEAAILERLIEPVQGALTPDAARYLLSLAFRPGLHAARAIKKL